AGWPAFLLRAHREEEAQVGEAVLEAEAQEQRRALRDRAVLAPGPEAPAPPRGHDLVLAIALRVQLLPGDVRLRIPLERLGSLPQLPDVGHGGGELERIAGLGEIGAHDASLPAGAPGRRIMRARAPDDRCEAGRRSSRRAAPA